MAGLLAFKDDATLKRMLLLDVFRGEHSTGLAAVRSDGEIHVAKVASHPLDLFDMAKFKTTLNGQMSKIFIGHNRFATKGRVNAVNAHPYQYGHIVGVHNGTLETSSWLELEKELGERFEVDSQALICAIAKLGIEKTVPLLRGAWSIVWYDQNENSLNFLRNKERPMWYAYTKDFSRMFWASEYPVIQAAVALSTQGYEMHSEGKEQYKYFSTEENVHYKFSMADFKEKKNERPKPLAKERKGKEPLPAASTYDPFRHVSGTGSTTHSSTTTSHGTTSALKKVETNVVQLFGDKSNPLAGVIDEDKFNELAKYGCSWCSADIAYDDIGITIFDRDDILLCPDCSGHNAGVKHSRIHLKSLEGLV